MRRPQRTPEHLNTSGRLFGLALIFLLPATGCIDPAPTSAVEDNIVMSTPNRSAKTDVPIQLSGSGVLVRQILAPDFGPPNFGKSTFEDRCSEPSDYVVQFSISGEASHLGWSIGDLEHCGLIDFQTGLGTDRDGILVLTASNGDELHGTYVASAIGGGSFEGEVVFDGGTGRFASAVGDAEFHGMTHRPTATVPSFELDGTIAYDAWDASR